MVLIIGQKYVIHCPRTFQQDYLEITEIIDTQIVNLTNPNKCVTDCGQRLVSTVYWANLNQLQIIIDQMHNKLDDQQLTP